jgi:hypothetical protein
MSVDSTVSNIPNQPDPNLVSQSTGQNFQDAASQVALQPQGTTPQAAPQAGQPQPQPQPQPAQGGQSGQPQPTQGQQPQQPQGQGQNQQGQQGQPPKQSTFNKVLEMATGGPTTYQQPTKDANGNYTGGTTQIVQHRSSKVLAAAILAHAVQGFLAGTGAKDFQEANAAGQKVGQQQAQQAQQRNSQAQAQSDQALSNQINITKHNLDTHKMILDLNKQQTDQMQSTVDDAKPIIDALELAQKDSKDPLILKQNLSEADLEKLLSDGTAHVTRESAIPDGVANVYDASGKQVMNPDGTPKLTNTFTVYNPAATVALTDELRKTNPELATAAVGQALPVKVLANLWLKKGQAAATQGYVDDFQKRLSAMTGQQAQPIDFAAAAKKDPILNGVKPILGRYAGLDPDQALDAMRKDKVDPNVIGSFQRLMGVNDDDLENFRTTAKKKAEIANNPNLQPVPLQRVTSFPRDIRANYPGLSNGQVSSLTGQLGPNPTQAEYAKVQDLAEKYDSANTARAQKGAQTNDRDQQTMWKTGINPTTKDRLSLDTAPDEFLVDTTTGNPIPSSMLSAKKPTMQESNRADFAKSAIHSLDKLNDLIDSNEAKFGPITGPVDKWMAGHGLGDEYEQAALNYLTFAQSASTGAHVGGRFNVPIMDKMGTTVSANMSKDQLKGATDSIKDIMQQYVDQGGRFSVAQYKSLPQSERDRLQGKSQQPQPSHVIPTGAIAGRDSKGNIIGYKTADGKVVKF